MGIFDRIRHKSRAAAYRLTPPLEPETLDLWGEVLVAAPAGTRISAGVVVDLIVEEESGRALPEEVAGYVVPYVVFSEGGVPLWAYVRDEDRGIIEFLRSVGMEVRTLGELRGEGAYVQAGGASPSQGQEPEIPSQVALDGEEQAGGESPEVVSTRQQSEDAEEQRGEVDAGAEEDGQLERDYSRLFWTGAVGVAEALKAVSRVPSVEPLDPPFAGREAPRPEAPETAEKRGGKKEGVPACPKCGAPMVLKTARRGKNAGKKFWSCSRFPECKGTRPYRE